MADRETTAHDFLAQCGWAGADCWPLAGDASFRYYQRLSLDGRRAVLMDAPPETEDVRPFALIARHLLGLDLSAPEILAEDAVNGFLLLEDFGDDTFTRVLAQTPEAEAGLYELAVDVLADLHRRPTADVVPRGLETYNDAKLLEEACLLTDWYLPAITGHNIDAAVRDGFIAAWRNGFAAVHGQPRTLVLRDYHVDNLIWLDGRKGIARCGLLDFQDAVAGPAAYDLMSLLEDARRNISADLKRLMLARYAAAIPKLARPGPDRDAFKTAFAVLAAQRHAKVIGIFTRLCLRDGKADYLIHIPRVWRLLEASLGEPMLAPVAAWIDRHIPPDLRAGLPGTEAAQ